MKFEFTREECLNLESSLRKEWLETNGLGGYACSTILNCHTRKYHGLLVVPVQNCGGRLVLLSKMEPSLAFKKEEWQLSTNKYPGVFFPTGHQYIDSFSAWPCSSTTYCVGDSVLRASVLMVKGHNLVLLRYELLESSRPMLLRLRPLIAFRGIHELTRDNIALRVRMFGDKKDYKIEPYAGLPALHFHAAQQVQFFPSPHWQRNLEYLIERVRGYSYQEDLFCPGIFEKSLKAGQSLLLAATIDPWRGDLGKLWDKEIADRPALVRKQDADKLSDRILKWRAGGFLIRRADGHASLIAGYPWFGEWGRDAMISLPGLAFCTGRFKEGVAVLQTFAALEKDGLLPNYLAERAGAPHAYNNADASLWFFWAVQQAMRVKGQRAEIVKTFYPVLRRIVNAIVTGRDPLLSVRGDGLLWAGNQSTQLTWMDACIHGVPVTPRHGLAVELNALWYNAISELIALAAEQKDNLPARFGEIHESFPAAFLKEFWIADEGYLADVVNDGGRDGSVRPNQVFAVSLPHTVLDKARQQSVLRCVERELATPYGLRTLSPKSPGYQPRCSGPQEERDAAYHQGTVWAWLVGAYGDAVLKAAPNRKRAAHALEKFFAPLWSDHLSQRCLLTVGEIFDGNPPHTPRGALSQAWSVGEVIRLREMLKMEQK